MPVHTGRHGRLSVAAALLFAAFFSPTPTGAQDVFKRMVSLGERAPVVSGTGDQPRVFNFDQAPNVGKGEWVALILYVYDSTQKVPMPWQVLYRFHPQQSFQLIAQQNEPLNLGTEMNPDLMNVAFLFQPVVDELGRVAFAALMEDGSTALFVKGEFGDPVKIAREGDSVEIEIDVLRPDAGVSFEMGQLSNIATFDDRTAAAFNGGQVFFRAHVAGVAGTPDAIWLGSPGSNLINVSNSFKVALEGPPDDMDGQPDFGECMVPEGQSAFFDDFTNLGHDGLNLFGLATHSRGMPYTVYLFDESGSFAQARLDCSYQPDISPRKSFRLGHGEYAFAGGRTLDSADTNPRSRGVFIVDHQVYEQTQSPAPCPANTTLGQPLSQALDDVTGESIFAARLIGGAADGKSGVFRGTMSLGLECIAYEGLLLSPIAFQMDQIFTVQVGRRGEVVLHTKEQATQRESIFKYTEAGGLAQVVDTGDLIMVDGEEKVVTAFMTPGQNFVETVVVGTGVDGHRTGISSNGEMGIVIFYADPPGAGEAPRGGTEAEGLGMQGGAFTVNVADSGIFADGFESGDVSAWSGSLP